MTSDLNPQNLSKLFYSIGNRIICINTYDEWTNWIARRTVTAYCFEFISSHNRKADFEIDVRTKPGYWKIPIERTIESADAKLHISAEGVYLEVEGSFVYFTALNKQTVEVWLDGRDSGRPVYSIANAVLMGLRCALRRCGLFELHAAGLVEPETDQAVLLVGPSRSGKSTLTMQLAGNGWRYLSDDMLLLESTREGVISYAFRRLFNVVESSARKIHNWLPLEQAMGNAVGAETTNKWVKPDLLFPDLFAPVSRPFLICFPEITANATTSIEKASLGESMTQLLRFCPWARYDEAVAREYLATLTDLINQCRTYIVRAGNDIIEEPAKAAAVFASLAKG